MNEFIEGKKRDQYRGKLTAIDSKYVGLYNKKYTEIQICPNKQFRRTDTIRRTVKNSKTNASIKSLRKKTTYYVRIRNVRGKGNSKTVSGWTNTKEIKS